MTMLVTLDEAKDHCEIDVDAHDSKLTIFIEAASAAVLNHVGDAQYLFLDTGGEELELTETADDQPGLRAKSICRQATLLLIEDWFTNRGPSAGDVVDQRFGYGYLPRAVVALLYQLRTPTIA